MPGSFQVLSPTDTASEATTKNQPPDIDIMVFHTRPGIGERHLQPPEALPGA